MKVMYDGAFVRTVSFTIGQPGSRREGAVFMSNRNRFETFEFEGRTFSAYVNDVALPGLAAKTTTRVRTDDGVDLWRRVA